MSRFHSARRFAVLVGAIAVVGIAAAAYAYWTTTGEGSGSGTAGTSAAVTVTQTSTVSGLVPGGPAEDLDFDIENPASHPQHVGSVVIAIDSITAPNADATHPCGASDFALVQPDAIDAELAPGTTHFTSSGASLAMNNSSGNQDGCKDATVELSYTA